MLITLRCCALAEPLTKILTAFSVVANTNMLLTTHADSESDSMKLRFIHGMRFWSSSWVILGHTYFLVSVTSLGEATWSEGRGVTPCCYSVLCIGVPEFALSSEAASGA